MEQKDKKEKTGCGKALFIGIGVYALLCLIYIGLPHETKDAIDSTISAIGVIIAVGLVLIGFWSYK